MERFFTTFWLLLIPTQLGRHFWLKESSVMGVRVDFLSIIFYLTDIVWLIWIGFGIKNKKNNSKKVINNVFSFQNFVLLLFVVVNIIFAEARWVAVYRWLRVGQWWLTWQMVRKNKAEMKVLLKKIVPIWIIFEAFLGLAQVVKGGSLNGVLWWLGERRFVYGGIGIAQIRLFDEGWIRAYGTFSHPNSLAGFLLLVWWWFKETRRENGENKIEKLWYWVVNWCAILGIILAGSRTVWGLTILFLIIDQLRVTKFELKNRKFRRELVGKSCLFLGIICLVLGVVSINYKVSDFLGGWDVDSFKKREMLALSAIKMIRSSPLFGVGAGNFVVNLPKYRVGNFYWMQPVHNIFLLAWSEIGILGLIVFLVLGSEEAKKIDWKKRIFFLMIVCLTGMIDHYWLTLPQNSWLLAIFLGII